MSNYEITNILSGYHSFSIDYTYQKFRGEFFNELRSYLDQEIRVNTIRENHDIIWVDEELEKFPKNFEIVIKDNIFTFRDIPEENYLEKSKTIFNIWNNYSKPFDSLRLIGFLRVFKINIKKETTRLLLTKLLSEEFQRKSGEKNFEAVYRFKEDEYNVMLRVAEDFEQERKIIGNIDLNKLSDSKEKSLKKDSIDYIYKFSKVYTDKNIRKLINLIYE